MKSKLRRLTFAALLLSNTSMTFAEDDASAVGDLLGYDAKPHVIPELPASAPSANHVGDLSFIGADSPNTVSDLGSNFVSDDSSNVVSDFGTNVVGDVVPNFAPSGARGTVVIGLAPSMLTDMPESTRSNFVEAVPLPIIAPPTTVASKAVINPADLAGAVDSANATNGLAKEKKGAQKPKENITTPDGLQNVSVQPFQSIAFKPESAPKSDAAIRTDCDCDETCDGGCEPIRKSRLGRLFDRCPEDSWLTTEFLLWHTQDRDSPALVATGAVPGFPILPDAQVAFGDKLQGEFSGGFRLDTGKRLTENLGVGVRFWILANNNDSFFATATQDPTRPGQVISMSRPFFNTETGTQDALAISTNGGLILSPGSGTEGKVWADSAVNMWAAEAYTRLRLKCNKTCKVDFLSGYSHLNLDDTLSISSDTFVIPNNVFIAHDEFETRNQFNGGQLGFELSVSEGRLTFRSMTKVHLGNMNQQVSINGEHALAGLGDPIVYQDGGLLAQGNQGNYERNKFAFIPEANFKLEYCIRQNIHLNIGYSFLYFDNVALAGSQIDPNINPNPIVSGGPFTANPAFNFNDSGMWVQGLDLGLRWDF
ncbi:MAG TPA: hypothetical protein DEF45_24855 [Rhodopirellula sp.]|nr:hypothetical protein [Rhodopirellula sp.]